MNLALLSLLALLSDLVCFATSSTPGIFAETYPGHTSASLIDIFLFTNVASCFIVTDTVKRLGEGVGWDWCEERSDQDHGNYI